MKPFATLCRIKRNNDWKFFKILAATEVNEHIHKQPSYKRSSSYLATLLQKVLCIIIIPRCDLRVFCNILSKRSHWNAKFIIENRAKEFTRAVVLYAVLREVAHGMVCLSESHRGLNFRDVVSVRYFSQYQPSCFKHNFTHKSADCANLWLSSGKTVAFILQVDLSSCQYF